MPEFMSNTWRCGAPESAEAAAPAARFDQALARARADKRAALATYLPVGYPDPAGSQRILHSLSEVSDFIELGWPYTDPWLDGPLISRASAQALAAGFRAHHLFEAIRSLSSSRASLLVMSYYQPLARYGDTSRQRPRGSRGLGCDPS
ncbi:tryptophan synthase subunit alpha [Streptomyces sp. NPDC047009]|uniref:tryptophan synthase subunit alpha n=1 Tax=Streptomyces sp. NPDC047009 TaxID=3154496 RepID=UPI0033D896E6